MREDAADDREGGDDYEDVAHIAQILKEKIKSPRGYRSLNDDMRESLDMICSKMSRILCGQSEDKGHWTAIAGYATLVADELED